MTTLFYGGLITPETLTSYRALPHALLSVQQSTGVILWIEDDVPSHTLQDTLSKHGVDLSSNVDLIELKDGEFLLPGFIDTHTHAPQVINIGRGQQYELLDWLDNVTFPMESKFKDPNFARKAYPSVVRRIIDSGTTTCCYFGTLHLESTKVLADVINASGQRAFVGKCNMNRNSPDHYVEPSSEASVSATRELVAYIRSLTPSYSKRSALVHPILTPRFAISCTSDLLDSLGKLAAEDEDLAIQTHVSENESEIAFTKSLFPLETLPGFKGTDATYTDIYDAFGLVRENTILAHGVHLEDEELEVIKRKGAGVSHCPTSNFNLRSGCAKVGSWLDKGIKVGLGTDVAGGFSPSILRTIQDASVCSKVVAFSNPSPAPSSSEKFANKQLPIPTLLYLATLGGASLCNLSDTIGSFAPGKQFDALVVGVRSDAGNPNVWGVDSDIELGNRIGSEKATLEDSLERFLFCGDDRNIRRVYVKGKLIGGVEFRK